MAAAPLSILERGQARCVGIGSPGLADRLAPQTQVVLDGPVWGRLSAGRWHLSPTTRPSALCLTGRQTLQPGHSGTARSPVSPNHVAFLEDCSGRFSPPLASPATSAGAVGVTPPDKPPRFASLQPPQRTEGSRDVLVPQVSVGGITSLHEVDTYPSPV